MNLDRALSLPSIRILSMHLNTNGFLIDCNNTGSSERYIVPKAKLIQYIKTVNIVKIF